MPSRNIRSSDDDVVVREAADRVDPYFERVDAFGISQPELGIDRRPALGIFDHGVRAGGRKEAVAFFQRNRVHAASAEKG
jgi:hypothetical protein